MATTQTNSPNLLPNWTWVSKIISSNFKEYVSKYTCCLCRRVSLRQHDIAYNIWHDLLRLEPCTTYHKLDIFWPTNFDLTRYLLFYYKTIYIRCCVIVFWFLDIMLKEGSRFSFPFNQSIHDNPFGSNTKGRKN